jgi:hypothetical protein
MNSDHMILAKNIDYKKLIGKPVFLTEKIDGVPGIFGASKITMSRQGKPITSVKHLEELIDLYLPKGIQLIGELHIPGAPFKESSGCVRRDSQCPELCLGIWDVVILHKPHLSYADRFLEVLNVLRELYEHSNGRIFTIPSKVFMVGSTGDAEREVKTYYEHLRVMYKERVLKFRPETPLREVGEPEGVIARLADETYRTGRSWGLQRYVPKPTADLRVKGLIEATANKSMTFLNCQYEEGQGLSAVGSLLVDYYGELVKVGPGAMSHVERRQYWCNPEMIVDKVIQLQYKADPTYNALREPTFMRLRLDKDVSDCEE